MDLDLCDEVMILSPRKVRVLSVVSVAAVASVAVIFWELVMKKETSLR